MEFIERAVAYIRHKNEVDDYRFVIPILVLPSTGLYLVHHFQDLSKSLLEIDGLLAISALVGLVASLTILAYLLFRNRSALFAISFLPAPDSWRRKTERLRVIAYEQEKTMKQIQRDLTHEIFGDSTPNDQVVSEMFKKNNRKSIGLYSDDEKAFVGFATVWPLTDQAAADILSDRRNETQMTADDLLPPSQNKTARYCLISALGVKKARTRRGKQRAVKLIKGFRRFFVKEFVGRNASAKTIMAVAEPDGEKWCKHLGMKCVAMVGSFAGQRPLYVRKFAADEIEDLLEDLF